MSLPDRSAARPLPLAGICILIVEDDCDSLEALRQLLQLNGAEVECAAGVRLRVRARHRELRAGEAVCVGVPAEAVWEMPDADEGSASRGAGL